MFIFDCLFCLFCVNVNDMIFKVEDFVKIIDQVLWDMCSVYVDVCNEVVGVMV